MKSDATWLAAHRAASKTVWIGFAVSAAAGVVALISGGTVSTTFGAAVIIIFLATAVVSLVQADRASATAS